MKIAIFQGFPNMHFEMIGYMIDFCRTYKHDFTIIAHENDWKDFYEFLFGKLDWNSQIDDFQPDNYDCIIVLTDNDPYFKEEWHSDKCIRIDHAAGVTRRPTIRKSIAVRPSLINNEILWALPCYSMITRELKIICVNEQPRVNIISIGINTPTEEQLKKLFSNFHDINFYIVAREIPEKYTEPNIFIYENASVNVMMNLICKCEYVFCTLIHYRELYIDLCMNGSIPMAFSSGCTLIMPKELEKAYGFKSAVYYDDDTKMWVGKNNKINEVFDERDELIERRNIIFDYVVN